MARKPAGATPTAIVQYDNVDIPPVYVEGAQGLLTPQGALQIAFFSEYIKPLAEVRTSVAAEAVHDGEAVTISFSAQDPFGLDGKQIHLIRRVEAHLVLTEAGVRQLLPWLHQKLDEMQKHRQRSPIQATQPGGGTP